MDIIQLLIRVYTDLFWGLLLSIFILGGYGLFIDYKLKIDKLYKLALPRIIRDDDLIRLLIQREVTITNNHDEVILLLRKCQQDYWSKGESAKEFLDNNIPKFIALIKSESI